MARSEAVCTADAQPVSVSEKTKRHWSTILIFSCWAVYTASIISKNVYAVELVEILKVLGITKAEGGVPTTCYYVFYGIAQIVFAMVVQKINLKVVYSVCAAGSAVCMTLVAFCSDLSQIVVLFGLNGILQCCIWAGSIYLITLYVPAERHSYAISVMSTGFSVGNLMAYLIAYLSVQMGNWQYAFLISGVLLFGAAGFLFIVVGRADKVLEKRAAASGNALPAKEKKPKHHKYSRQFIVSLCTSVIGAFACMFLYYAAANNLPLLLFDVYNVPSKYSILLSTLTPLVTTVGPLVFTAACSHRHISFIKMSNLFMIASMIFPVTLLFTYRVNVVLVIAMTAIFALIIKGVSTGYGSIASLQMEKEMNAGSISAITNVGATVGAALAPVLFGYLLDTAGWTASYVVLISMGAGLILVNVLALALIGRPKHVGRKSAHKQLLR